MKKEKYGRKQADENKEITEASNETKREEKMKTQKLLQKIYQKTR